MTITLAVDSLPIVDKIVPEQLSALGCPEQGPSKALWLGRFFGYPECCIIDFMCRIAYRKGTSKEQRRASQGSGFIPCPKHTVEVLLEEVTLQSLLAPYRRLSRPLRIRYPL